ncbi:MAG: aminoacyl-tRNA hydrolase [Gemmataceae bacterium]|nr:aminoacyl-tRNA hydrolase [Gemmata sp.]MDW8196407.1 aminoacyl-tRNA hydrolase [Gemmataceae bacterium]
MVRRGALADSFHPDCHQPFMKVIVGLGNPGAQYAGTRHNVGFEVIDYLAAAPTCSPFREKFQAVIAETQEGGETVLLVKPLTFMNLSGRAVRAILDFYKVPIENLLVVCDDLNLPLGKLRLRAQGSHGGQNGLRNIQDQLGTTAYARLRIGIGPPSWDAVDHVLSKFRPSERPVIDQAIATAAQAVLVFIRQGITAAMNQFNAPETTQEKNEKKTATRNPPGSPPPREKRPPSDQPPPAGTAFPPPAN